MAKTYSKLHAEVESLREAGKFEEALQVSQEAKKAYMEANDMIGLADLYGSIALTYRHLNKLAEAEQAAKEGIKIADDNNLKGDKARPLFNLAKVQEDMKRFGEASQTYRDAIKFFMDGNPTFHNRSGVLADMKIHQYVVEYKAGDKVALEKVLAAIKELEDSNEKEISKYNYDVWLSGAHMKIAEMLKIEDNVKAREHLQMAKDIIGGNPDLKIRNEQWEELASKFNEQ